MKSSTLHQPLIAALIAQLKTFQLTSPKFTTAQLTARLKNILLLSLLSLPFTGHAAEGVSFKWTSSDVSIVEVLLGPEATFFWKNPDGNEVRLTGGTRGATFSMTDTKTKGGSVVIDPASIIKAINPMYGKNGEAAIPASGQITEGSGTFELSLTGFKEIADVNTVFTASLVSNGSDNPINLNLFGQGDQLAFNPPGSVNYVSKWTSSDVVTLSNGAQLTIGNFYLLGGSQYLPDPSQETFEYSLTNDPANLSFASTFTSGEKYVFTDSNFAPTRFEVSGLVSKVVSPVPEPATLWLYLAGGLGLFTTRKKWQSAK